MSANVSFALPANIISYPTMSLWATGFLSWMHCGKTGVTLQNNPLGTARPGGGIYYLSYEYNLGTCAQRITELLHEKLNSGKLSFADMQKIQADTLLEDAPFFVPYITGVAGL
jgi:penicillin amidase